MANFKNSNDVYNKIISVDKLVDIDEIFFNGNEFDFVTKVTSYDPLTKKYTAATDDVGVEIERPFDISMALEDLILSQYLPEFTDYFADINRYSNLTAEELAQLKNMLTKRSSFSYQFKGTKTAIEFVLSIFSNALGHYLLSADPDPYRNFVYRISTDLPRELWLKDVKPIVHPNGWGDNYILIIPEFPDYVRLKGEAEIREIIKHTPAAFSYLDVNYWYELLKPKRTFTFVESALASVKDVHEHFKFNFHHYAYDASQAFTDSIHQELMLPGYFETRAVRTSSNREYHMEYHRAGVALEYHWTIFRNGVIVRLEKTYQPTLDFTPIDDVTHEAMLTLKRGSWEHTVGPFKLYTIHRPGVFPASSAAPQITDESILDITVEDKSRRYELLDASRGDHHLNRFRDAEYDTTMTDWLSLETMAVSYDLPYAVATNYQTNRVFYTGPEMVDRYVWTIEKNGNPLMVKETIEPELVISTLEWETEPETSPGNWAHPGVKSGWEVTLTVYQGEFTREVGTVTFGSLPDVEPPASFVLGGLTPQYRNTTSITVYPSSWSADVVAWKVKLDTGAWSSELQMVGGVWIPQSFTGLSDGQHFIYYTARDAAGNWMDEQSAWVVIDTAAPNITLTSTVTGNTTNRNQSITVSSTSGDAQYYRYSENAGATWSGNISLATPITYTNLVDGAYSVIVRVYDNAGNYGQASVAWTVDNVAPIVTANAPSGTVRTRDYSITVSGTGATKYQYRESSSGTWSGDIDINTPIVYSGLHDSSRHLEVVGKDAAGNIDYNIRNIYDWVIAPTQYEATYNAGIAGSVSNYNAIMIGNYYYGVFFSSTFGSPRLIQINTVTQSMAVYDILAAFGISNVFGIVADPDGTSFWLISLNRMLKFNGNVVSGPPTVIGSQFVIPSSNNFFQTTLRSAQRTKFNGSRMYHATCLDAPSHAGALYYADAPGFAFNLIYTFPNTYTPAAVSVGGGKIVVMTVVDYVGWGHGARIWEFDLATHTLLGTTDLASTNVDLVSNECFYINGSHYFQGNSGSTRFVNVWNGTTFSQLYGTINGLVVGTDYAFVGRFKHLKSSMTLINNDIDPVGNPSRPPFNSQAAAANADKYLVASGNTIYQYDINP